MNAGAALPSPPLEEATTLTDLARAAERKLRGLFDDLDGEWRALLSRRWGFLPALPDGPARHAVLARLFQDHCAGLPALERLLDPVTRLALLPRADVLARLCALALARRPGVLRCCIDRDALAEMRQMLGNAQFEPLMAMSRGGRPPSDTVAGWSSAQWACLGYHDWVGCLHAQDGVLRRWVRLALPRESLVRVGNTPQVPADLSTAQALQGLADAGVAWPC